MRKKYLVALKNPPVSFMVDDFDTKPLENEVKAVRMFTQDNLLLFVTKNVDANIAYVQEMDEDDIKVFEEKLLKARGKLAIVKPKFIPPGRNIN